MRAYAAIISILLLTGCCHKLSVRSEYITEASFASYYVDTPDPRRGCPLAGQRLIVDWNIPSALWHNQSLQLDLTVRFRNHQEWHQIVTGDRPIGTYVYEIDEVDFEKTGGFLSYRVKLLEDGEETEDWVHPLWQDRITFEG